MTDCKHEWIAIGDVIAQEYPHSAHYQCGVHGCDVSLTVGEVKAMLNEHAELKARVKELVIFLGLEFPEV